MTAPRDEREYAQDICDAADYIAEYVRGMDRAAFMANTMVQDAVVRRIEIVGEATKNLSPAFREARPAIPWRAIAGMRDRLIHAYFGVQLDLVWVAATDEVPALRRQLSESMKADPAS
jgi:uncharacterized protein with HEPN domain